MPLFDIERNKNVLSYDKVCKPKTSLFYIDHSKTSSFSIEPFRFFLIFGLNRKHCTLFQVSLIFLLYGDTPLKAKIGLQRLLILYHDQQSQTTDIITNWIHSHNDSHWRSTIIEALWTIKAKHVLRMVRILANVKHIANY